VSAIFLAEFALTAQQPVMLRPGAPLQSGGSHLQPGQQAIPCVVDWDEDGRKDLLAGYRYADKVALYLNAGTDAAPVFSSFTHLRAGGVDIEHPSVGCGAPAPWVCDYDGDGQKDLLVGTGAEGYVYFYRNTASPGAPPVLATGVRLVVGTVPLTVSSRATPYVHDWDEDGLPDLLCGAGDGQVYLFKNQGTRSKPAYSPGTAVQAAGKAVNAGQRSALRVLDWDGDGVKDLVCSGSDNACWYRNTGSNASPQFSAPTRLRAPVSGRGLMSIDTSYRMRLEVVDWDNDGVWDLLVGDSSGLVYQYPGYRFAITSAKLQPDRKLQLEWSSAPFLQYSVAALEPLGTTRDVVATNLVSGGNSTSWTVSCEGGAGLFRVFIAPF
jgi:hypothetical protein